MLTHPPHEALSSSPVGALPVPEAWRSSTRPAAWTDRRALDVFREWEEMFLEGEVFLSPELEAAYDRAIDAAFAKVMDRLFGPARQAG